MPGSVGEVVDSILEPESSCIALHEARSSGSQVRRAVHLGGKLGRLDSTAVVMVGEA